jgi:hypothetical protein
MDANTILDLVDGQDESELVDQLRNEVTRLRLTLQTARYALESLGANKGCLNCSVQGRAYIAVRKALGDWPGEK